MDEDAEVAKAKQMAQSLKKEEAAARNANRDPNDLAEYNLDDYDAEESRGSAMGAFSNIK